MAILDNGVFSVAPVAPGPVPNRKAMNDQMSHNASATNAGANGVADDTRGKTGSGGKPSRPESSEHRKSGEEDYSLRSRIETGRSFVESRSKFCPWQFPSDPHGTQMANLICAIDPSCKIYVARVAEDASGYSNKAVKKVSQLQVFFPLSTIEPRPISGTALSLSLHHMSRVTVTH